MKIPATLAVLDHLGQTLLHWNEAVCQPKWISYLEFHGLVPGFLLGTLWVLSGRVRSKEIQRIDNNRTHGNGKMPPSPRLQQEERKGSLQSHINLAKNEEDLATQRSSYPSVAIVLPIRGYRPNSIRNWQAIVTLDYPSNDPSNNDLEFIFVMEDKHDPAHTVIQKLVKSTNNFSTDLNNRSARIVYSGLASNSSQKIHNLIAGISAATAGNSKTKTTARPLLPYKYILCLDDDVHLHPTALSSIIRDMEASHGELRIATGYPFDIPSEHAGILSYAALAYHLPLVIGFSLNERTHFVWGGCMLFRAEDVRPEDDLLGFLSCWAAGGYSDDLTVAARCTELGVQVFCPSYAIFPQYLDAEYSPLRYWNYLRRQLVVLDTYASDHNRRTNHVMAVLHCYFSWAFVVPVLSCSIKMGIWVGMQAVSVLVSLLVVGCGGGTDRQAQLHMPYSSLFDYFSKRTTASISTTNTIPLGYISAVCFITCSFYAAIALRWMTSIVCTVMEKLNPHTLPPNSLLKRFHWGKLWVGFIAANAVLPVCMVYTFITRHITWAGVKYRRQSGKIIGVEH
jgi:hypothetical protein